MHQHKLIFSDFFARQDLCVTYLDVGARGDVGLPWSLFADGRLKVIGFEPDGDECDRLNKTHPNRKYYPHALWGSTTTRSFYLCERGATSSMYPPNEEHNQVYLHKYNSGRVPQQIFDVECVALGDVLAPEDQPDFIKIDTQGAELEILKGAEKTLKSGNPLVLTETWCAEIYKGAPLTHEVMAYMYGLGYQVFDINIAAAWQHQNQAIGETYGKAKTIGFDLLFVKQIDMLSFDHLDELLKFAGLCELYGFRDYALAALERFSFDTTIQAAAIRELMANDKQNRSVIRKGKMIWNRLRRKHVPLWPALH